MNIQEKPRSKTLTAKLLDDVIALNELIPDGYSEDTYEILSGWIDEIRNRFADISLKKPFLVMEVDYKAAVRVFNEDVMYKVAMNGELFHYLKPEATNWFHY